jgi:Na+/H+-dicarboxylate symporter
VVSAVNKDSRFKVGIPGVFYVNLVAIALGLAVGLNLTKTSAVMINVLDVLAILPITLIKAFAVPLLFLAICHGFLSDQPVASGLKKMFFVCLINALIAASIALILVNVFRPGIHLTSIMNSISASAEQSSSLLAKRISWMDGLKSMVPESLFAPFLNNNIPSVLLLAVLFGVGARTQGAMDHGWQEWYLKLRSAIEVALSIVSNVLLLILKVMPIAIFAAVAKAVSFNGLGVFKSLAWYAVIPIAGMILQVLIVYHGWIKYRARRSLGDFWKSAKLPVVYSFGVNSSLASLPATLSSLDHISCSKTSSRLGACVGTNFNNDGILLYEVAAVLMIAQSAGVEWSLSDQFGVALLCIVATLGVSGFPEAGIVALSLVLPMAGLPLEMIPYLLPVDWLVARFRSATNVVSDMTVSLAIDGPVAAVD